MATGKFAHLVMVTSFNNNKFYDMTENADGTFTVVYGRVDASSQVKTYPIHQWDKKYNEKIKKGYKDMTEMIAVPVNESTEEKDNSKNPNETLISKSKVVEELVKLLQEWAHNVIKQNYKVTSNKVTQKMIDTAQDIINKLTNSYTGDNFQLKDFNDLLLSLYTVIPRKMNNVKDYLARVGMKDDDIKAMIENEQKLLDTMAGQVYQNDTLKEEEEKDTNTDIENQTLLEKLGLEIELEEDKAVIKKIRSMMGESASKMNRVFRVNNIKTRKRFDSYKETCTDKTTELLFHGSRNQNWYNIILTGLMIRPSGVILTGSMFGNGIYFANKAQKSIGYTSVSGSYWAHGNSANAMLGIFEVNVGKEKPIHEHTNQCYKFDKDNIAPYDSVHAYAGKSLRNDEIIIYEPSRCTIKYLVEVI